MGTDITLAAEDGRDAPSGFGFGEHLLVWSWRRMAAGRSFCPLLMDDFAAAFGDDGPEVFATFCTFLQALAVASRKPLMIGAPGCSEITADERQALTLIAAAQAEAPAMLEAHLRWIAFPEKRLLLRIAVNALARARRQRDGSGSARTHLAYRMRTPACAGEEQRRLRGNTRMTAQTLHAQLIAALPEHALPKRAKNALLRGGIATLEDAAEWTDRDLLSLPHMGKAYVASLRALTAR